MKTDPIKAPEGINLLLENLWLRHKAGMQQPQNKVFSVELPPLTKDNLMKTQRSEGAEYDQEELLGRFV